MSNPIIIDGSQGEGGGQMLRTSISMSAITGRAIHVVNIRANRQSPGLKRQHLTCVRAAATICGASVTGDAIHATEITFTPGPIQAGSYRFEVGSAGSVTLVAQTVLPILLCADAPSEVTIVGGTHVPMSPSWDFFTRTYLPQFRAMGIDVEAKLKRYGFYPAGGGEVILKIQPWTTAKPLHLVERGATQGAWIIAKVAHLPINIASSEVAIIASELHHNAIGQVDHVEASCPGNYCFLMAAYDHITEVFSEIGTHGKSRKAVANSVTQQAKPYLKARYAVDTHLSDQLLLPILLAAKRLDSPLWAHFTMPKAHSLHFDTNWSILQQFCEEATMVEYPHPTCPQTTHILIGQKGVTHEMATI